MLRLGTIVAVCVSRLEGLLKFPRDRVQVGTHGLVGDFHNKELRRSFSEPGTFKPNTDRHITIVAEEVFQALNRELGTTLSAGSFGENLLVRGLGDLSDIPDGARLRIGEVILRVSKQNKPCHNLAVYDRLAVKRSMGRRGLLCSIEQGQGEYLQPGDLIEVLG